MREKITGEKALRWEASIADVAAIPPLRTGKGRQLSGRDDSVRGAEIEEGFHRGEDARWRRELAAKLRSE
jgi:hypothetical protein